MQRDRDIAHEAKQRKERQDLERFRQKQITEAAQRLLGTEDFTLVMGEILAKGGMFQSQMTGNSATYYNIGRSDYAKEVFAFLAKADRLAAFELLKIQPLVKEK